MSEIIKDVDNDKLIIEIDKEDILKLGNDPLFSSALRTEIDNAIASAYLFFRCKDRWYREWTMDNKEVKQEVQPERLRRITGYLVGDVKGFNDGKKSELKDRTKHLGRVGYQQDKELS